MAELPLQINVQMMETMTHGSETFPAAYYVDVMDELDFISLHWHPEFELYYVKEGSVEVRVAKDTLILQEGEGMFINSNVLHGFRQVSGCGTCLCPNIVLSPKLLFPAHSILEEKYYHHFLLEEKISYMYLSPSVSWQKALLQQVEQIFAIFQILQTENGYGHNPHLTYDTDVEGNDLELEIAISLLQLWKQMYRHKESFICDHDYYTSHSSHIRLQKMITFIQDHYQSNINLESIAQSANISRSEAGRCFRQYTFCSPVDYLIRYRINCAKQMLLETQESVSVISEKCGFTSVGYFGKTFKKITGFTPVAYRR